ncbi:molybdate ABC transporter permease subunit [Campylobacter sp. faydin G-24]|uniref:Molybdenum transport system permease n=1 Tax=Campylobacter anatolicus TaxID=2829105 RepID=A0ABS5HG85_9BACT|nr:molybdate ABC transporter permease subunit [Campylobacter anatolicus]MBR8462260.1 molybdate ABC transporter permease subunit [Campylobacter anatolicus]MBR8463286.1 molybdate ABC transporter permease subunit [Campylobacter anatolicus]MBR8465400.1 molybdate ABC transporter permease subunit [Campylobacter anatolicus]
MFDIDFTPFLLSLKLSFVSTAILFCVVLPLAYAMSRTSFIGKPFIETIVSLPLVLPPSVLGFYLLVLLSPYAPLGEFLERVFDVRVVFNFAGLVIASCIYSLPFMFQPLYAGFNGLKPSLFEASYSLGKSRIYTLFRVILPNIKPNLLTAIVVSFAHTMGEFGVVLMIGGSVAGQTKVASIAIFEATEMLDYTKAHIYAALMLIISFSVLFLVYFFNANVKKSAKI